MLNIGWGRHCTKKKKQTTHKQQTHTEFRFLSWIFHLFINTFQTRTPRCDGNGKMHPVDGNIWLLRKIFVFLGHKKKTKKRREQRYCIDLFIGLTTRCPSMMDTLFSWHAWALIYNYTHPTAQHVLPRPCYRWVFFVCAEGLYPWNGKYLNQKK